MMSRPQVVLLQLSVLSMTATGLVFAWMKYFLKPADEFAVVNHPLQPWMLAAHVVLAPLAVFAFGWVFGPHIWPGIQKRTAPKRTSGIWSAVAIAPMVFSGYLLQVTTADTVRHAMAVGHWISSALFVAAYLVHYVTPKW
jgi:uncharacterized membrane protein YidH (DUF202 family)